MRIPIPIRAMALGLAALSASLSRASAQNTRLVVNPGAILTVSNSHLVLYNTNLDCNGIVNAAGGTVWVAGANSTSFNGTGVPQVGIFNLKSSPSSILTLYSSLQVSQKLVFQTGIIDLNGQTVKLNGSGVLQGENETSRITGITGGKVTASAIGVNNPAALNIGNLGAILTSSANLGNVTVSRMQQPAVDPGNASLTGIQRTYLIQPQNNNSINATLRFTYLDAELNAKDASTLALWKSEDGVGWTFVGVDSHNATDKYVEKSGIADLSYWTLSDIANPLPLTLLSFRASCDNGFALIQWQTGVESGLADFWVEASTDGGNWKPLGSIAASNSSSGSSYSYKDVSSHSSDFYRLKIVDQSDRFTYSPVFRGSCSDITLPFMVYPNPAVSQAVAQLSVREATAATIRIVDAGGRLLRTAAWNLQTGINQYVMPVGLLARGTYLIQLVLPNNTLQTKLIKK